MKVKETKVIKNKLHDSYDETYIGDHLNLTIDSNGWQQQLPPMTLPLWTDFSIVSLRHGEHWFYHHKYKIFALEMITEGNCRYEQDGRSDLVERGQIYLIHRGSNSKIMNGPAKFYRKLVLGINGSALDILLETLQLREAYIITPNNPDDAQRRFLEIHELLETVKAENAPLIAGKTYEFLVYLSQENASHPQRLPKAISEAVALINSSIDRNLQISEIAAACNVSTATLYRMFQKYFKQSPQEYMTKLRMAFARQWIVELPLSFKEIAARLGYRNQLYFSMVFKKENGISPTQFRRRFIASRSEIQPHDSRINNSSCE